MKRDPLSCTDAVATAVFKRLFAFFIVAAAFSTGCSKPRQAVTGQVFIATKDGANVSDAEIAKADGKKADAERRQRLRKLEGVGPTIGNIREVQRS